LRFEFKFRNPAPRKKMTISSRNNNKGKELTIYIIGGTLGPKKKKNRAEDEEFREGSETSNGYGKGGFLRKRGMSYFLKEGPGTFTGEKNTPRL